MTWTLWGLAVQTVAGFFRRPYNRECDPEHRFGFSARFPRRGFRFWQSP